MHKQRTIVGFTGTRRGMTEVQAATVHWVLKTRQAEFLHHGDCVGADAEVHEIARLLGIEILIHPPVDQTYRAFCEGGALAYKPTPYIERNHMIVRTTNLLIAAPGQMDEITRSGTWATVRYARKKGHEIVVVYPDGTMRNEEERT